MSTQRGNDFAWLQNSFQKPGLQDFISVLAYHLLAWVKLVHEL